MYDYVDDQFDESGNYDYCEDTRAGSAECDESLPNPCPALSTTLWRDFSSKRFIIEMLLSGMLRPIAPPAMKFNMERFTTGNMMCLRSRSRSLVE